MAFFDVLWITAAVIGAYCIFTREKNGNFNLSSSKHKYENENNFCENCGDTLNKTAKFCGSCGTKV
jgi:predicted amidophosphoribosyltransferase